MDTGEKRALAALWSIRGVGPVTLRGVRAKFGALAALLDQPTSAWVPLCTWHNRAREELAALPCLAARAEQLEAHCRGEGTTILFPDDAGWPARLSEVPDAPPLLFAQGPASDAPRRRRVAIVGGRHVEPLALRHLRQLAADLARAGVGVVSGGASGCDQAAHGGALDAGGETWSVLGNALDQIDLPQAELVAAMRAAGQTLLSQFPPGQRANQNTFVQRNAVISGVADAVLVCRAGAESGALYTATFAKEQGRPVLAMPGNPWEPMAAGSNALLRDGARLVLTADEVLDALGVSASCSPREVPRFDVGALTAGARQVYQALHQPTDFDELVARVPGLSPGAISAALVELEVRGGVVHLGARRYEKR